ncbi:MAG: DNA-protecting protein DprA [Peptococcaceae bacterium]|nr:DNA-protecting protein DprA [Peptococcaceae bacterium]
MPGDARAVLDLIDHFGSPETAWHAAAEDMITAGIKPKKAHKIAAQRDRINLEEAQEKLAALGIDFICYDDDVYPQMLKHIYDPPVVLFYKGSFCAGDDIAVAIVGSRKATYYGKTVAEKLAGDLARNGVTVVSGMARGIDTAAHKGALAAGGRTIAVLGTGLDNVYPRENTKLMEEIAAAGLVLTEFPPESPGEPWHFPLRNRIISGLSRGIIVVEAAARSGALITASLALEQGREVMAVPGNITIPVAKGPNRLIKQGAKLVENVGDVLEEIGLTSLFPARKGMVVQSPNVFDDNERRILKMLQWEPLSKDAITARLGLNSQQVSAALSVMEIKGLVRRLPGGLYCSLQLED